MPRRPFAARRVPVALVAAWLAVAGCGDDHGAAVDAVLLDDASDEAWGAFKDAVDQGHATVNDARAAALTAPQSGQTIPGASPIALTWAAPAGKPAALPHGIDTGRFVWLVLSGGGELAGKLNVVALSTTTWTPDAASWAKLVSAGTVRVDVYTATLDTGAVTEGPFSRSASVTFTIAR
jgi:hypothetical protein